MNCRFLMTFYTQLRKCWGKSKALSQTVVGDTEEVFDLDGMDRCEECHRSDSGAVLSPKIFSFHWELV